MKEECYFQRSSNKANSWTLDRKQGTRKVLGWHFQGEESDSSQLRILELLERERESKIRTFQANKNGENLSEDPQDVNSKKKVLQAKGKLIQDVSMKGREEAAIGVNLNEGQPCKNNKNDSWGLKYGVGYMYHWKHSNNSTKGRKGLNEPCFKVLALSGSGKRTIFY